MNLRVDLILESEQRSASRLNSKTLTRISVIAVPAVVGLLIACAVVNTISLNSRVRMAEAEWKNIEPKKKKALDLADQVQVNLDILNELEGWNKSHVNWHAQLNALQGIVPPKIQLERLRISQTLQLLDGKTPARVFTMILNGKATGATAERDVHELKRQLEKSPFFSPLMGDVTVPKYGPSTAKDADKSDRMFQIDCPYKPRKF